MIHFTEPSYDIACIGDTAGFDLMFAEYFSAAGLRCKVFRHTGTKKNISAQLTPHSDSKQSFSLNDIVYFEKRTSFIKEMQNFRCIASIGGALPVFLGRKYWPFRNLLNLPPVIQITTGSDVMERSIEKSFPGRMFRQYLKFTKLNVMVPYPLVLKNLQTLNPPNIVFLRFPYYLLEKNQKSDFDTSRKLKIFHPSNLDWNATNPIAGRVSTKGNDRFFKGLSKAIAAGLEMECVVLDRGKDREAAHQLINELGLEKYITWKPHLTRDELKKEMISADIVIDQFDVGGLGGVLAEAMSLGKPVMTYIDEDSIRVLYPELPPVLNCRTEEEITAQLLLAQDRDFLKSLGQSAHEWIYRYHSSETVMNSFLFYYSMITGHTNIHRS